MGVQDCWEHWEYTKMLGTQKSWELKNVESIKMLGV